MSYLTRSGLILTVTLFTAMLISSPLYGVGWVKQDSGTEHFLHSVYFADRNNGCAVGNYGTVRRTMDGGNSWHPQSIGSDDNLQQVYFLDRWYGFAVAPTKLYRTSDGGWSWTSQELSDLQPGPKLCFLDINNWWATSVYTDPDYGYLQYLYIHRTTDGGMTWEEMYEGYSYHASINPVDIDFHDYLHGYCAVNRPEPWGGEFLLATHDGGISWSSFPGPGDLYINDIDCVGPYEIWAGSNDGLIYSPNGGSSWTYHGTDFPVFGIDFLSSDQGWAVGGSVISTTDGGASWLDEPRATPSAPFDVMFVDSQHGWAVGLIGTILRYDRDADLFMGAQFVDQHYPLSMTAGNTASAWIEYRNTGTLPWLAGIAKLGTTEPRDRASAFSHSSWEGPNRPHVVQSDVYPGETYRFAFTIDAPVVASQTTYTEHWGLVEEGVGWFGPPDDAVSFDIIVNPSAPAGPSAPLALMKDFSGNQSLFVYNAPGAGDYTLGQAAARNQPNAAYDHWVIPAGNNNPCTVALDIDGDGTDELAVLKSAGIDQNLFIYNAPLEGEKSYAAALARNPSPLARDFWCTPRGNGIIMLANAGNMDGVPGDELAVMKRQGPIDYNLYLYRSPAPGDWSYWDALARNPSPLARDLWFIPFRNDAVTMAGIDTVGDDVNDHLLVLRERWGDQNLYLWNVPAVGDWSFSDAIARNPSPAARDFWAVPYRSTVALMTCVDAVGGEDYDEIAVMTRDGGDDNLYVYNAIRPGDWTFWDAAARNPSPIARDEWIIPISNNASGMMAPR